MKKILYTLICILIFSCNSKKPKETNELNLEKYFALEYGSFDNNGETINYVTPTIAESPDTIGKIINQRQRRIRYLLTNRINSDTLNKLLPDSTAIEKIYFAELNNPNFKSNLEKIIYPNQQEKQEFTKEQMMSIASKFFLVENHVDRGLVIRICSGINGQIKNQGIDFTLLEIIVFDAIFDRILNQEMPRATFLDRVNTYLKNSIEKNKAISSLDSLETITRQFVFESMENDNDLRKTILEFYKKNKNNIPITITEKK